MSPEQTAVIDRLIRERLRETIEFNVYRLCALIECMKAYRMKLPNWWRGSTNIFKNG